MALSATSLQNAICTYTRQHQTETALRLAGRTRSEPSAADSLNLSHAARNIQQIQQAAAARVEKLDADLSPLERQALASLLEREARVRFSDQLEGELLAAQVLQAWFGGLPLQE